MTSDLTGRLRLRSGIVFAVVTVWLVANAAPAAAHPGGAAVTSNYRTSITHTPEVHGLQVRVVDLSGAIELRWTGEGTLEVEGYEGEPYLRFDSRGTWENTRSPAAYLNRSRFAVTTPPEQAMATASPLWRRASGTPTARWHDHRTHWMSDTPPIQVQLEPNRQHVIREQWEIPLRLGSKRMTVTGRLTWSPPPQALLWWALAAGVAVACAFLLALEEWAVTAAVLGTVATTAFAVDTIGLITVPSPAGANRVDATFLVGLAIVVATRSWLVARRRPIRPTPWMLVAGLTLAAGGGFARLDVWSRSQLHSAVAAPASRVLTAVCLGMGSALLLTFLRGLVGGSRRVQNG